MADGSQMSLKGKVSDQEWQARVDLAALYRLVALHGWDDMIFTHISARVPGPDKHFLINPFGWYFEEITASSLVKVDMHGAAVSEGGHPVNPAGFTIHSAVHQARDDAHFVIHVHTDAGVAVSAQAHGLLPLTQHACLILPLLAYHEYEGVALNHEERERIVHDLGDKHLLLLRNHGTLALGGSAAEAWINLYYLEKACQQQVKALSGGRENVRLAPDAAQAEVRQQSVGLRWVAPLAWPGALRQLDRKSPGYDA
jgi:ribulose-5-phosphate 4-epimerase/fuculose-1-phosphate aldolase